MRFMLTYCICWLLIWKLFSLCLWHMFNNNERTNASKWRRTAVRFGNFIQTSGCGRDRTGQDFLDRTRPVNFKIYTGRPVFLQKVFVQCSTHLMKIFQKEGGMGKVLKCVTPAGGRVVDGPTNSGPNLARIRKLV